MFTGINVSISQLRSLPERFFVCDTPAMVATVSLSILYAGCAFPVFVRGVLFPGMWTASIVLGIVLVLLSVIDIRIYRLPDVLTLPLIGAGLLFCEYFHWDRLSGRFLAAILGYALLFGFAALYVRIRGREGLGLGDAKLFAASGAWLGLEGLPSVLLLASGTALSALLLAAVAGRRVTSSTRLAFGPFLAFGTWAVWLYGAIN
jgi:leader peptidase (prepilin peptidase)/N-methyltransferase